MKNPFKQRSLNSFQIKFDLKMKLTTLFLIVSFLNLYANESYAQKTKITLHMENATIENVLYKIESLSDFKFMFNDNEIDYKKKITVIANRERISSILTQIFSNSNVAFEVYKKQIILKIDPLKNQVNISPVKAVGLIQQTITGNVSDINNQPLLGVNIAVEGTTTGAITDFDGNYSIKVDSDQAVLVFTYIGMKTVRKAVGQNTTVNVRMIEDDQSLQEIIITATGARKRVEMGNSIANLKVSDDVKERPINNVFDILQGQAAGVSIGASGGSVGMGSRIRIRGSNSASLSNEPVIYVDGVLINNESNSISFETGGQSPSRLDDINPEDIESIEVVKGPSAATLYGSIAANGVILITTKKGSAGDPRWSAFMETGFVEDVVTYPKNYQAFDASGNPGFNFEAAEGTFVHDVVNSFQPLNDSRTSPFRTGQSVGAGLSVSGGSEALTYFLSGSMSDSEGVVPVSNIRKTNFRGNFGAQITDELKMSLTTSYTNSDLELPLNDNFALALMSQGLNGTSSIDVNDGWGEFTPAELFTIDTRQLVNRFTSGLETIWKPSEKINVRVFGGLDFTSRWDSQFFPTGEAPAFLNYDEGARFSNRFNDFVYTFDAVGSYSTNFSENITSRTSVGLQYLQKLTQGTFTTGLQLVAGSNSIAGAAVTLSDEQTIEQRTIGAFIEEQVGFNDKLYVTGAVRTDRGSSFGSSFKSVFYPKLSASWLISNEDFFNPNDKSWINSLRLRGAWGASGVQPGTNDALRFFDPIAATVDGVSVTGVTIGGVGNADLKPELSKELEFGADIKLFSNRISLDLTYFNKQTEDALIFRQLPPSLGVGAGRFENLGSVKNTGLEITLNTSIVETEKFYFDLGIVASFIDTELKELGEGIEPVIFNTGIQRHIEGYPLGGYWDEEYTFNDANGDGFIGQNEVQVGETVYLGTPFATTDITFSPTVGLFNNALVFRGLLNYKGGQKLYNNTGAWRNGNSNTQELNDPNASLAGQARAVASKFFGTNAGYIEDASFWRLREISLTYNAPQKFVSNIGFSRVSLTLSGQNLGIWTDYSGLDPEISSSGQDNFETEEFLSQPPTRSWKIRLNLSF
ncbi:SusC/RagA family TonB-linked outer membrane protein [Changchengzhania lutea]|uniref:SusC/RagA family TonB-linked outer membrane protein n=1 Tax=Changchengzhania lutea TaxID=2049305 RepID=UPI00115D796E|nr:SusC/RagA family TonB-linked outer membrane protein [Changchengzhania lutea]